MRLTYRRVYIALRENSKMLDQTITKLFYVPQNTDTIKKNRLTLEEKYSYNPSEILLSFSVVSVQHK